MRVLITNSLVLAAITLVPSASAAPYTTSSVDAYESYSNSTVPAQESGPSSVPSMLYPYGRTLNLSRLASPLGVRRDEIIHVQSLYDGSPFGDVFGPVAHFFDTIGMNTISDNMPLTEAQKADLDQLHDALNDAAGSVIAHLPANHPLLPLSSRSLEDRQIPNPLATLGSLSNLGNSLSPVSDFLSSVGIEANPTTPLTDFQKQVIAKVLAAINTAVENVAVNDPRLSVLPFSHQARSVEERSLENILSTVGGDSLLSSLLQPVTDLISSLGVLGGTPLDGVQTEALSRLQVAIAEAVQNIEPRAHTVHIEHTRGEHERWDHHDNHQDPHRGDHHSQDEHKDRNKSWDEHKESGKSSDKPKESGKPLDKPKESGKPLDEHKDENKPRDTPKPHDVHKDDHKPHDVHKEDHDAHRGGDRCRESRDGQRDDCKYRKDGKDKDEDSSLRKISLGHSHHP